MGNPYWTVLYLMYTNKTVASQSHTHSNTHTASPLLQLPSTYTHSEPDNDNLDFYSLDIYLL
jgi:hypothetical protein